MKADDLSGHVVIIGGIAWNDVMRRLMDLSRLPVRQEEAPKSKPGKIFLTQIPMRGGGIPSRMVR